MLNGGVPRIHRGQEQLIARIKQEKLDAELAARMAEVDLGEEEARRRSDELIARSMQDEATTREEERRKREQEDERIARKLAEEG